MNQTHQFVFDQKPSGTHSHSISWTHLISYPEASVLLNSCTSFCVSQRSLRFPWQCTRTEGQFLNVCPDHLWPGHWESAWGVVLCDEGWGTSGAICARGQKEKSGLCSIALSPSCFGTEMELTAYRSPLSIPPVLQSQSNVLHPSPYLSFGQLPDQSPRTSASPETFPPLSDLERDSLSVVFSKI